MVNTRNNNLVLNTPLPIYPIQAALAVIQETLANIQAEVRAHSTKIANLKRGEETSQPRTNELTAQQRPHLEPNNSYYGKLISIEFPKFSDDDVKDWVYRCKQFFKVGGVPDERKIHLPSLHMFDAALVCETYGLARMQEATNNILKPRYNTLLLPTPKQSTTTYVSKVVTTPVKSNSVGQSSGYVTINGVHKPYILTQRELEDKRAKGRCFYYDQKYAPGHKCSGQLHVIEVICGDDFDNYIDGDDETYQDCVGDMIRVTDSPQITLNALSGLNSYQTMRVRGRVGKQLVLRGMNNTHVHWMQGNEGMMKQAELSSMALCVYPVQLCQMKSVKSVSVKVEQVLTQFDEVFEVKGNQEKDKIESKPDKNGERGEAGKSLKQLQ
nr:hypothetical protein [Tanacetum cinerariifolium]